MDDPTRLEEKEASRRVEAQEIPEDTYYHVPRVQEVEVFGQAADVLPYDRPAFRRRWVTQPLTFTCAQCHRNVTQERYPGPVPRYCGQPCKDASNAARADEIRAKDRDRKRRERARVPTVPTVQADPLL